MTPARCPLLRHFVREHLLLCSTSSSRGRCWSGKVKQTRNNCGDSSHGTGARISLLDAVHLGSVKDSLVQTEFDEFHFPNLRNFHNPRSSHEAGCAAWPP